MLPPDRTGALELAQEQLRQARVWLQVLQGGLTYPEVLEFWKGHVAALEDLVHALEERRRQETEGNAELRADIDRTIEALRGG